MQLERKRHRGRVVAVSQCGLSQWYLQPLQPRKYPSYRGPRGAIYDNETQSARATSQSAGALLFGCQQEPTQYRTSTAAAADCGRRYLAPEALLLYADCSSEQKG
jgi:hypothetical protein